MKQLPRPETYEDEIRYMPWGILMEEILARVIQDTPKNSSVLDLMCGPGQLIGQIAQSRKDLSFTGVDNDARYIDFAKKKYPANKFVCADAISWETEDKYDLITITGGLHHVPFKKQPQFLTKIVRLLANDGTCLVADPYIDDYGNEKERKLAAAKLGYEYIKAVIENNAPDDLVSATIDILSNDLLPHGEFKNSIKKTKRLLSPLFSEIDIQKTWPTLDSEYGDYYFILARPNHQSQK